MVTIRVPGTGTVPGTKYLFHACPVSKPVAESLPSAQVNVLVVTLRVQHLVPPDDLGGARYFRLVVDEHISLHVSLVASDDEPIHVWPR